MRLFSCCVSLVPEKVELPIGGKLGHDQNMHVWVALIPMLDDRDYQRAEPRQQVVDHPFCATQDSPPTGSRSSAVTPNA